MVYGPGSGSAAGGGGGGGGGRGGGEGGGGGQDNGPNGNRTTACASPAIVKERAQKGWWRNGRWSDQELRYLDVLKQDFEDGR